MKPISSPVYRTLGVNLSASLTLSLVELYDVYYICQEVAYVYIAHKTNLLTGYLSIEVSYNSLKLFSRSASNREEIKTLVERCQLPLYSILVGS